MASSGGPTGAFAFRDGDGLRRAAARCRRRRNNSFDSSFDRCSEGVNARTPPSTTSSSSCGRITPAASPPSPLSDDSDGVEFPPAMTPRERPRVLQRPASPPHQFASTPRLGVNGRRGLSGRQSPDLSAIGDALSPRGGVASDDDDDSKPRSLVASVGNPFTRYLFLFLQPFLYLIPPQR